MPLTEGFYWVRESADGPVLIAAFADGEWDFGDLSDDAEETELVVIGGPLEPPIGGRPADWQARYDNLLLARKAAGEKDPLLGWDFLSGYYWVSVADGPDPVLAHYLEGWTEVCGDVLDDEEVEIIEVPLPSPPADTRRSA